MKRTLSLIIVAIALTGCSSNDTNNEEETANESEDELVVDEKDLQEQSDEEDNESDFEVMLEEFLIDSYEETSFTDFRHTEKILSEELLDTMYQNQQSSEVHYDEEERTVQEFELYTSSDNPNRYVYRIVLDIDKSQTEHYGEVLTNNENGSQKIEDMKEINMNEL